MNKIIERWDRVYCLDHVKALSLTIVEFLKQKQIKDIVYMDIGANVGKVFDLISRIITFKKVYFFEPSISLFDYLKEKYPNNINLFNLCLLDEEIEVPFDENTMYERLLNSEDIEINLGTAKIIDLPNSIKIKTKKFSNFLIEENLFNENLIIKMDTENCDFNILKDILRVLNKFSKKPVIFFEQNYFMGNISFNEAQIILDEYTKYGYNKINLDKNNRIGDLILFSS